MVPAAALAAVGVGCGGAPPPEEGRLREILEQGEALSQAADELEDRLLAGQANVFLWRELARRHQHISAVVTRTQTEHFASMVRMLERQEGLARRGPGTGRRWPPPCAALAATPATDGRAKWR